MAIKDYDEFGFWCFSVFMGAVFGAFVLGLLVLGPAVGHIDKLEAEKKIVSVEVAYFLGAYPRPETATREEHQRYDILEMYVWDEIRTDD